jgi:hypothetical protein
MNYAPPPRLRPACWMLLVLCLAGLCSGCQLLGVLASKAPDPTVGPKYKGLANQKVGVMVWADRATSIDWPHLQLDVTRGIQARLSDAAHAKNPPAELKGTTFVAPESVVRYQQDHPEIETESVTDIAPRIDITRLIYLEINQFSTRPEESLELYRGSLSGNLKVVEVVNGRAKIAYQEDNIKVVYPEDSPEEGIPGGDDLQMYEKTLDAFSTQVANRFLTHTEPRK